MFVMCSLCARIDKTFTRFLDLLDKAFARFLNLLDRAFVRFLDLGTATNQLLLLVSMDEMTTR